MKMLSIGCNSKLGKKIAIFNLPARKTCPGATAYCGKICYAMKAERMYKAAAAMRHHNWDASLNVFFVQAMTDELKTFKGDKVRIHESGDWYSQEYLDKWIQIAAAFPKITFLAYTKSYNLDFSKKPANLVIYASYDPTTQDKIGATPAGLHECVITDPVYGCAGKTIASWYHCPPISKTHRNYCGVSCNVCWAGSNNVIFQKH